MLSPLKKPKNNKKDSELHDVIYAKVTKENHKHESPDSKRDETLRKCKQLFKQGASPKVLTELEELLRARQDEQAIAKHLELSKQGTSPEALAELEKSVEKKENIIIIIPNTFFQR
ncbi:hypothetical protein [Wolbachia endosymbiont (group B) of Limnophora tigrina]|uniref:hypothetical protein n=1 Tax=Wolbachia endosymbiont (group B) of Limnophora tigrina TaxID=3139317 RepID=UPI0035B54A8B